MSKFTGFSCVIDHHNKVHYFKNYKEGWREQAVRVDLIEILKACSQLAEYEADQAIALAKEAKGLEAEAKAQFDANEDLGIDSVSLEKRHNEN